MNIYLVYVTAESSVSGCTSRTGSTPVIGRVFQILAGDTFFVLMYALLNVSGFLFCFF